MKILYLGIASGTTASHFSDLIGRAGLIYGVEIAERPMRDLIKIAEARQNIIPILADARLPKRYAALIFEKVDCVYEDIADPDMVKILIRNVRAFLKPASWAMMAIKSQSIDVVKSPRQVYAECLKELERHFDIVDKVELDPYQKAHLFVVMRWKR
jgi:fibrillarin-like pre-rRNA processing protein